MRQEALAAIAWERLRRAGRSAADELGIPSLELDVGTTAGLARVAIGTDGDSRLLLPLAAGDNFPQLSDTPALELKDSVLSLRGRPTRFIEIVSRERALEEVFEKLSADILRRLGDGAGAATAVEDAVGDFRALLLAARHSPSSERAVGLAGELITLNALLAISPLAWRAWTGPLSGRHDFRNGDLAFEVKTSLRAQRKVIEVSAIDQLLEPEGGQLLLIHHVVEHDAGGAVDVAALAERALQSADDRAALADRLAEAGYASELREAWSQFRFSRLSTEFYRVQPGFPRLVTTSFAEGELPAGVSHFRYRVDLAFAASFRLAPTEGDFELSRMAA